MKPKMKVCSMLFTVLAVFALVAGQAGEGLNSGAG